MTGRELIVYILKHGLENEEMSLETLFYTVEDMAVNLETGVESIKTMYELGLLEGFKIGDSIYFVRHD